MAHTLTARWIFPADRPPLAHGTVTIQDETIVAVQPALQARADQDLGQAAILPGLVNAHTHLDLSGAPAGLPPGDFPGWLRRVVQFRRQRTAEQVQTDIRAGLAQAIRHGTTLLGDISGQGLSADILRRAPIRSVVFLELLGLSQERADLALPQAESWLAAFPAAANCRPALSPHAPYSIRRSLFEQVAELANREKLSVAIHLAESAEEMELLAQRRGPMADFLRELGAWDPAGLIDDAAEVPAIFAPVPGTLLIHANYLRPSDARHAAIVYCPRTHAAFAHPPHPFREHLVQGRLVALGTDSLASNPDLSVLEEVRHIHRNHADLAGDVLLRLATLHGAKALGLGETTGSLTPGKSADLVVVPLAADNKPADPHRLIFDSDQPVQAVMCRGQWIWPETK